MEVFYSKGKKYNCIVNGIPYYRKSATIAGKRRQFYGDGEKDANRKIEEAKNLSLSGLDLDKKDAKVTSVFRHWLYNVKRIEVKASSFTRYECTYRTHIDPYPISSAILSKLDSATMQAYVNHLYEEDKLSAATIKETLKVWRMFLLWAQDEGYLVKNPIRNISLPEENKRKGRVIEVFTEEERQTLLAYMDEHGYQYDIVIKLAFATGMRQGELLGLKWADIYDGAIHIERSTAMVTHVDKDGNRDRYREVWETKTANSVRTIPLMPETEKLLRDHHLKQKKYFFSKGMPQSEYVFTANTGELIEARNFIRSYERLLKRAGIPYRKFHTIRHTFATEAIRKGVDVKDLQLLLGHSDIETTYIYVQCDDQSKRTAMEKIGVLL